MKSGFMRTALVAAAAVVCGAAASPAQAGTVYVPLAGRIEVAGVSYETRVWVSNPTAKPRRVTTRLIDEGEVSNPARRTVRGQSSMLLTELAGGGDAGLLELTGPAQLVVNAELVSGGVVRTSLPVISSTNVFLPKKRASVVGLVRSGGDLSGLALFNLGRAAATCNVSAWSAAGERLGPAKSVRLAARDAQAWGDVLGAFGASNLSGARVTATCDRPFHLFGVVLRPATGDAYVLPAAESADSVLEPFAPGGGGKGGGGKGGDDGDGGDDPGTPPADPGTPGICPQGAAACFARAGAFFTSTQQEPYAYYRWPVPSGTRLSRIEASFRMKLHRWDKNRNGFYTMFYLPRGGKWLGNGVALIVAREKGVVTLETTLDLKGSRIQAVRDKSAKLRPGETYDVRYIYDAANRRLHLIVKDSAGRTIVDLHEPLQANSRAVVSNGWFGVQLSDPYIKGTDHVPLWATWSDLTIAGFL